MELEGRVCLVTGASTGIGFAISEAFARAGASLVMICRDSQHGERARRQLMRETRCRDVRLAIGDLSSIRGVARCAEVLLNACPEIHVLVNAAAVIPLQQRIGAEGLEMQFAVNHMAYFLLTTLLLNRLRATPGARILNLTAMSHFNAGLNFMDLYTEIDYRPRAVYDRTKLFNLLFTYELDRRIRDSGVTVNAIHPGVVEDGLFEDDLSAGPPTATAEGPLARLLARLGWRRREQPHDHDDSPAQAAHHVLRLAADPALNGISGRFYRQSVEATSSPSSYDRDAARRLWEMSARLANYYLPGAADFELRTESGQSRRRFES